MQPLPNYSSRLFPKGINESFGRVTFLQYILNFCLWIVQHAEHEATEMHDVNPAVITNDFPYTVQFEL